MLFLPTLSIGSVSVELPLGDASAAALAEFLLGTDENESGLAETLRIDPVLLYWTLGWAESDKEVELRTVDETARALAVGARRWLLWPDGQESAFPCETEGNPKTVRPAIQPNQIAYAVERAERVARSLLSESKPFSAITDRSYFSDLIGSVEDWLLEAGVSLPHRQPLSIDPREPDAPDETDEESILEAASAAGGEARRHAKRSVPGAGTMLPELARRLARLGRLETEFQACLEHEKLEAMAEFAAGAGHEINNPIAVIAGRAQLFLQSETDPERRHGLALMNAQAKRVFEMIADMRLFARPPEPNPEVFLLNELVDEVIDQLTPTMAERMIELGWSDPIGPIEIEADRDQMAVMVRALCRNAFEAIGHDGHVEIGLFPDRTRYRSRHDRRWSGGRRGGAPPHVRPVLLGSPSGTRLGAGAVEMLANRGHQPRRNDRRREQPPRTNSNPSPLAEAIEELK